MMFKYRPAVIVGSLIAIFQLYVINVATASAFDHRAIQDLYYSSIGVSSPGNAELFFVVPQQEPLAERGVFEYSILGVDRGGKIERTLTLSPGCQLDDGLGVKMGRVNDVLFVFAKCHGMYRDVAIWRYEESASPKIIDEQSWRLLAGGWVGTVNDALLTIYHDDKAGQGDGHGVWEVTTYHLDGRIDRSTLTLVLADGLKEQPWSYIGPDCLVPLQSGLWLELDIRYWAGRHDGSQLPLARDVLCARLIDPASGEILEQTSRPISAVSQSSVPGELGERRWHQVIDRDSSGTSVLIDAGGLLLEPTGVTDRLTAKIHLVEINPDGTFKSMNKDGGASLNLVQDIAKPDLIFFRTLAATSRSQEHGGLVVYKVNRSGDISIHNQ